MTEDRAAILKNLNAAIHYRDTALFIRYLEKLVIIDGTEQVLADKFDIGLPALFAWFKKGTLTWSDVSDILHESGYKLHMRERK